MNFKRAILVAMMGALLSGGTASAFIPNPGPGTWKSLTRCLNGGTIELTSGQYLRIGWGSLTESQSYDFLAAQDGTVAISDDSGVVLSWTWPAGDTALWTEPMLVAAPGNTLNGGKPLWLTFAFLQVNGLPTGNYTISANMTVNRTVFDGSNTVKRGSTWFSTSACALVVG